jgi:hypothetical protein
MQRIHDAHNAASRLVSLLDELTAGCDSDFDTADEELDREFAEIRLQLENQH